MNGEQTKKSVWPKIILGCFGVFVLGVIAAVVLFQIGTRKIGQAIVENAKNPALRAEKAKKMLGASALPEGYFPMSGTFELPLITSVRLYDRAPDKNGFVLGFDKKGFIFVQAPYTDSTKKLEAFFSGETAAPDMVEDIGVRYRATEDLRKGSLTVGSQQIRYRAARGRVEEGKSEADGPVVLMWIDCAGKKKERYAAWFSPDTSMTEESSIRTFVSQFDLCRAQ